MEKEHVTVTEDGRILRKAYPGFEAEQIARVEPGQAEAAVAYFESEFKLLEKYVTSEVRRLESVASDAERKQGADRLREQIVQSKALGNFDGLLKKIAVLEHEQPEAEADSAGSEVETESAGSEVEVESAGADAEADSAGSEVEVESAGAEAEADSAGSEVEAESADKEPDATEVVAGDEIKKDIPADQKLADDLNSYELPEELEPLRALALHAAGLVRRGDWQMALVEWDKLKNRWNELLQEYPSLSDQEQYALLLEKRNEAEQFFTEKRAAWKQRRREQKKRNLDKRAHILEQLKQIVEKKKWQSIKQVQTLSSRWEDIRDLPDDPETVGQQKTFDELVGEFNENKVAFLVKKAQKEEENLAGKLLIIEKMQQLVSGVSAETSNWKALDKDEEELAKQWRKIGHVPMEQSDQVWEQFKQVRESYLEAKLAHDEVFRKQTSSNIRKKTALCEQAEKLLDEKDLAIAVREINQLHKKWKKIGQIPKEKNDELWERFNAATRNFNKVKSENLDQIREQEQQNYDLKEALCQKAEELRDATDWNATAKAFDELLAEWKKIGPVPRRKAGKVWKRFKKALDTFYENRRRHYREIRDEQKQNYETKKKIVAELRTLTEHENPQEAVQKAKDLQEQFRQIGFVPIKKKDKIEKAYKEVCDIIYGRMREAASGTKVREGSSQSRSEPDRKQQDQYFRLKKECDTLQEEILRYRDSMTFINPGGKGNALIEEIQAKVDKAQQKLDKKLVQLEELRSTIR